VNQIRLLVNKVKEVGLAYTLHLIIRRWIPTFIYDSAVQVVYNCNMPLMAADNEPDAPIRWGTEQDIEKLDQLGYRADECRRHFARGDRVIVYEMGKEFYACCWFATQIYEMVNWFHIDIAPNEVFGASAFTRPDQRGKRINTKFWRRASAEFLTQGYKRYMSTVHAGNRNSLRANENAPGTDIICRIWYARLLGLTLVRANGKFYAGWWTRRRPFILASEALY
jgi:hypothetical protein